MKEENIYPEDPNATKTGGPTPQFLAM